jgi:acylphosphatase
MEVSYRILIKGRVQGVGFRAYAVRISSVYGVKGWVKNMPDGNVQVLAQGDKQNLELYINHLRQGPSLSYVSDIEIEEIDHAESYEDFDIKF